MPYTSNRALPKSVQSLPKAAQTTFRKIVNAAIQQYGDVPEKTMAVAWAGLKGAGWYQDAKGTWHKRKKARATEAKVATAEVTEEDLAWLTTILPSIEESTLTEEYEPPDPREEAHRSGIFSLSQLLACADHIDLTDAERSAIAAMMNRLSTNLQDGYEMDESASAEAMVNLDAAQDVVERQFVADELHEAGQRHRDQDYQDFDTIMQMLKRIRGQSPKELQAEREADEVERRAADPTTQMTAGYHAGEPLPEPEGAPVAVAESLSLQESMTFLREADGDGRSWLVSVIQAGLSKNQRRYALDVLREASHLFEGARVYVFDRLLKGREVYDHLSDEEYRANPKGYAKDLVGYLKQPMIEGSSLVATLQLLPSADWLRNNLREAFRQGKVDVYGLSIDAEGDGHWVESGGHRILEVDAIRAVTSVDVVSFPAAGGRFMRLVASVAIHDAMQAQTVSMVESMTHQLTRMTFRCALEDAMDEAEMPSHVRRRFRAKVLAAWPH